MSASKVERTRFPVDGTIIADSFALYRLLAPQLWHAPGGNRVYAHGGITSSIAARLVGTCCDFGEAVAFNKQLGRQVAEFLPEVLPAEINQITLAHDSGLYRRPDPEDSAKLINWNEFMYMVWWCLSMTGGTLAMAKAFIEYVSRDAQIDVAIFSHYQADRQERQLQYDRLTFLAVDYFECQLAENRRDCQPIVGILSLPDTDRSLGATCERQVAEALGIQSYDIQLHFEHPAWQETTLWRHHLLHELWLQYPHLCTNSSAVAPVSLVPAERI